MSRLDATLGRVQRCDEWLCVWMNGALRHAALLHVFRAISWLGDGLFWYALMLALLVHGGAHAAPAVLHMIVVGVVCTTTYRVLKRGTSRPRPYKVVPAIAVGAVPLDAYSFPSGHTLHAVAFTIVAASHTPALAGLLAAFTALTAVSRVVLGLHYPSDVAAGALIGGAIAGTSCLLAVTPFWI
jgi:undecaprenyl-diphosphatase